MRAPRLTAPSALLALALAHPAGCGPAAAPDAASSAAGGAAQAEAAARPAAAPHAAAATDNDAGPAATDPRAAWPAALTDVVDRARRRFDAPTLAATAVDELPAGTPVLDVRTAQEASVSRIPGARLLTDDAARQALLADPPAGPVLVTCAAGWRSAQFTLELRERGVEAWNLEGGVFAWAAAGGALVDSEGRPTTRIHAYDRGWASCVPAGHTAVTEPAVP